MRRIVLIGLLTISLLIAGMAAPSPLPVAAGHSAPALHQLVPV